MNHAEARAALRHTDGWHKSSISGGQGECVEINTTIPGWTGVRDSKLHTNSPILTFTHQHWRTTLTAIQNNPLP